MGFSVSGSAAIIFVAAFIGFGMFYTASANSMEQINDARTDQADRTLEEQNTEIEIVAATWDDTDTGTLTVEVENTGATELSVEDTDLLIDGEYQTLEDTSTSVETDSGTDVWASQQTLTITVTSLSNQPDKVKVVTENGVADTEVVS